MIRRIFSIIIFSLVFCGKGSTEELRDVKPPVALPPNFFILFLLLFLILAVLLFFLIRFLSRRIKKNPKENIIVKRKPWEIAYDKLENLKNENFMLKGEIKKFYSYLSDIIRVYIEGQFQINAPDMTTEEFLSSLRLTQRLNVDQKKALEEFLNCCDMVKFAKYSSTNEEIRRSFSLARQLVDETKS